MKGLKQEIKKYTFFGIKEDQIVLSNSGTYTNASGKPIKLETFKVLPENIINEVVNNGCKLIVYGTSKQFKEYYRCALDK